MKKQYNLGWGESVAVRQALLETQNFKPVVFDLKAMQEMGYPAHEGEPALIELTRKIIKRQIGREYKHVLITNGATGGVTISLRTLQIYLGIKQCVTGEPPYFRFYPAMVKAAGLVHYHANEPRLEDSELFIGAKGARRMDDIHTVFLVDSLSNPLGNFSSMKKNLRNSPIVWDAVYFSKVYCPGNHPQPDHDILVGSYSKLTGLNGLRTGWIATDNDFLYEKMKLMVTAEYCGVSAASTKVILETIGKMTDSDWERFEKRAQQKLDANREEFSKLEKYFGNQPVGPYGMFYYAPTDKACRKLLEKSGIIWSPGSHLGTSDDFGRFNVGQDCDMTKEAVREILKNDKR